MLVRIANAVEEVAR